MTILQWKGLAFIIMLTGFSMTACAQNPTDSFPKDPGSLSVTTVQNLSFGSFAQGPLGGKVVVSYDGARSATGDIVALNLGVRHFQAIFELEAPVNSIISILNGPDVSLTGSNGGSMMLHLSASNPVAPFSTTVPSPGKTIVNFGGTLTVGSPMVTVPGKYTGTFSITFNQE